MVRGTRVPAEPAGLPAAGGTAPPGRPSHHRPELPRAERQPGHDPGPREDPVDPVADHARPAAATPAPTAPSPAAPGRAAPCRRHGPLPGRTAVPRAGAAVPVPLHDQGGAAGGRRLVAPDAGPRTGRPHTAGARSPASGPLPGTTGKPARKVRKRPPGRWAPGGPHCQGPSGGPSWHSLRRLLRALDARPDLPRTGRTRAIRACAESGCRASRAHEDPPDSPKGASEAPRGVREPCAVSRGGRLAGSAPATAVRPGGGRTPATGPPRGLLVREGWCPASARRRRRTPPRGQEAGASERPAPAGGAGPVRPGRQSTLGRMCGSARSSS